jgi:hypothetical protein
MRTPNYVAPMGVKSIQRGTVSIAGNTTTNVTINAVDTSKSVIILATFASYNDDSVTFHANLTTATNLALIYYAISGFYVTWQVVEYY